MNHFWFGAGLLAVLLAVGLWTSHAMENIHTPIADSLSLAAEQTLSGDTARGIETARQAYAAWELHRHATAAVADHAPMEEADGLFAQMEAFVATGDFSLFAACCTRLSELVRAMGEANSLTWWNLL